MNIVDKNRKNINNILSIVKLCALILCGIAIFSYNTSFGAEYILDNLLALAIYLIITFSLIYVIWSFSIFDNVSKSYKKLFYIIQNTLFMTLFTLVITNSGANISDFKIIFLLLVITTTIELGTKIGLIIATISSIILFSIDFVYAPIGQSIFFEQDLFLCGIFIFTSIPLGYFVNISTIHLKYFDEIVNMDNITQLYNQKYFNDKLSESMGNYSINKSPFSIAFININNFKHYNDLFGYDKGNYLLKQIGCIILQSVYATDIVARFHGDKFAIIFSNCNKSKALDLCEMLRKTINKTSFLGQDKLPYRNVTVSIGTASYPTDGTDLFELIDSANTSLKKYKSLNTIRVSNS